MNEIDYYSVLNFEDKKLESVIMVAKTHHYMKSTQFCHCKWCFFCVCLTSLSL